MPTIRDPQTDVSTANYSIGGKWNHDQKLSYNSSLAFTNDRDIPDKEYIDSEVISAPIDENNIYYVGKHGNDITSDGRTIADSFLTIQKGINEAYLQTPTISSEYIIRINDSGSYDSFTLVSKPYINLKGKSCKLHSSANSFIIGDNNSITFDKGTFVSGTGTFIEKQGSGESYLNGNEISGNSVETAIKISGGSLIANLYNISIPTSNIALHATSNSTFNYSGQNIKGKIKVETGANASINIKNQTGNIEVTSLSNLNLVINGRFDGNITIEEGAIVDILIFYRVSGYTDNIPQSDSVNIRYIGHHIYTHNNLLVGGDYAVNPRQELGGGGRIASAPGQYLADNTIAQTSSGLSSGNGENNNLRLNLFTDHNYFGILIPIKNKDLVSVIGDTVSISFRAAWTAGTTHNLRMALLSWTHTEDVLTRNIVDVWGPTPILATGWLYEQQSVDLPMTGLGTYHTHKIENIAVDTASTSNLGVFIWTPYPTAVLADYLEISNVRCNQGPIVHDFAPRHFTEELLLCRSFYSKSYSLDDFPGTLTYQGCFTTNTPPAPEPSDLKNVGLQMQYPVSLLKTPEIIPYAPKRGKIYHAERNDISDHKAVGNRMGTSNGQIELIGIPYIGATYRYHWVADARL